LIIVCVFFNNVALWAQENTDSINKTLPGSLQNDSTKNTLKSDSILPVKPIKPRIVQMDSSLEEPVYYSARDSIYSDLKKKIVYLFGEAKITYGEIEMTADYMEMDLDKKQVLATYTLDKDSNRVGEPHFKDGSQEMTAASISYNFDTKKAYIEEVRTHQDEGYLYMEMAKRQANEEIHFKKGRFSTCDLEQPHFHFQLSRAILIPDKRIVTGPANLWIKGIPTPLALPFGFFPLNSQKKKGLVFPKIAPVSQYGFGLQDIGFYTPLGKKKNVETTFFGTIYSRGVWGLANLTNYKKRYKSEGTFRLDFQQFRGNFIDTFVHNKISLNWKHTQDTKSNPYWRFGADVNFISDNNTKNNINPVNPQYFNNQFRSSITVNRLFPGKPYSIGMKLGANQSTQTKTIFYEMPTINFNMTRIYPFKALRKNKVGKEKWYEKIGMTYGLELKNQARIPDSLYQAAYRKYIGRQLSNGVNNNINLTTTIKAFKGALNIAPTISYQNFWNFQKTNRLWDATNQVVKYDTSYGFYVGQNLNMNINLSSAFYSFYRVAGLKNVRFRHVARPTIGFSYIPNLSKYITSNAGINGTSVSYSPFERSLYHAGSQKDRALITFGLSNIIDMKVPSKKDSTGTKRIGLVEGLSFNGNYDVLKDSMKLSDLSMALRLKPLKVLSVVASAVWSPYNWNDSTGADVKDFALEQRKKLGRYKSFNLATTLTLTNKAGQKILSETADQLKQNWNQDYQYYTLHPEEVIDFRIPWKLNISHNIAYRVNTNRSIVNPKKDDVVQTISFDGQISISQRWMIMMDGSYDINQGRFTNIGLKLSRNLHCWSLTFQWYPLRGVNNVGSSFLLTISANANLLRDLKQNFQKPPIFQ
jgi:hypothetical protein